MSTKIHVLDEQTINQIAAGEVIENPSSVVKELVENSIDAGATEVIVEIRGGGRQLIRVTDNGSGMSRDDALLSLERHATSKIRAIDDIHDLFTMGFRGEAIPSIASISKFTLLTRLENQEEGSMVIVDGGKIVNCTSAACSPGTTIEVKSLFFNVPVRKKFQRSPTYDANEIQKMLTVQALGHPEIKFRLISNQKTELQAKEVEAGKRISEILGKEYFATVMPLSAEKGEMRLQGFIGMPGYSRHNRTGQYLFINSRAVSSPLVSYTVRDSYGTALATNRHPVFVLYLEIPAVLVDPNVHPQKKEVRLRHEEELRGLIREAVGNAMQSTGVATINETIDPYFEYYGSPKMTIPTPSVKPTYSFEPVAIAQVQVLEEKKVVYEEQPFVYEEQPLMPEKEKLLPPKVLATVKRYVVLEGEEGGVLLLDQKAAHSRVIYEKMQSQMEKPEIQSLLIPYTLEVTPVDAGILRGYLEQLQEIGIQIEEFGAASFIIQALPASFGDIDIKTLIDETVDSIRDFQDDQVVQKEIQKQIAMAASRAAVGKEKKISLLEAESLVRQWSQCESPNLCPLGKKIVVELSQEKLAKLFD